MKSFTRHRRHIVWLCIAAVLLMGLAAQRHVLAHALQALHASAQHDALVGHSQACEQCLQFAAFDSAAVGADPVVLPAPAGAIDAWRVATQARAEAFTAYASRAPPGRG